MVVFNGCFVELKKKKQVIVRGMSNTYLKIPNDKKLPFGKLRFSKFEKLVCRSLFVEPQLTQISLKFTFLLF